MIPRDTLLHYTIWNPPGERQRRYTTHLDEIKMMESARIAIPKLENAIYDLILLHEVSLDSPDFVVQCTRCAENLNGMVEAIVYVIKYVSRKVFAEDLRPYFDSIIVQGKEYLGPGAVEMPLFIFDHLLWSAECQDEFFFRFKQGFLPYCLPAFRSIYAAFKNHPSLLAKVGQLLETESAVKNTVISGANALMKLFHILIKFRKPHVKVVDQAYVHAKNRAREKGSGGYQVDTLDYITTLTSIAMEQLSEAINQYKEFSVFQDGREELRLILK